MRTGLCSIGELKKLTQDNSLIKALEDVYRSPIIHVRFDALCNFVLTCDRYLKSNQDEKQKHQETTLPEISKIKNNATRIMMAIVDAKDAKDLQIKIEKRALYKKADPGYMPWHAPSTRTNVADELPGVNAALIQKALNVAKKMAAEKKSNQHVQLRDLKSQSDLPAETKILPERMKYLKAAVQQAFVNVVNKRYCYLSQDDQKYDKANGVFYVDHDAHKEIYRIFPHQGKFHILQTQQHNNIESLLLCNFDTKNFQAHNDKSKALFVVSPKGDIFVGSTIDKFMYHSTFLAGGAAVYAGTMSVGKDIKLDAYSGHYLPGNRQHVLMLTYFRQCGLLSTAPIVFSPDPFSLIPTEVKVRPQDYYLTEPKLKLSTASKVYVSYLENVLCSETNEESRELINTKLRAMYLLRDSLDDQKNPKDIQSQLFDFRNLYKIHNPTLKIRRDSGGMIFLKCVVTLLTVGLAAALGIWNVKGRKTMEKMESSYQKLRPKK